MNNAEITQDDLYDLGFEPIDTGNTKTIDYEHKELGIKLWRGMTMVNPESKYWKTGYGKDKINFETLDQLKEYMESVKG
jgi:hypothetical protein